MLRNFLLAAFLLVSTGVVAEEEVIHERIKLDSQETQAEEQYCTYKDEHYSPGSIIDMSGSKRECRNGYHDAKKQAADAARQSNDKLYYSPNAYDESLEWRTPI